MDALFLSQTETSVRGVENCFVANNDAINPDTLPKTHTGERCVGTSHMALIAEHVSELHLQTALNNASAVIATQFDDGEGF